MISGRTYSPEIRLNLDRTDIIWNLVVHKAYILVSCEPGCEISVVDELRVLPSVDEVNMIYGSSFEIIIKLRQ